MIELILVLFVLFMGIGLFFYSIVLFKEFEKHDKDILQKQDEEYKEYIKKMNKKRFVDEMPPNTIRRDVEWP